MVVDWEMRLLLPVLLALEVDSHGRVWVDVGVVHGLRGGWVRLHRLPALAIVQLHPIIFTVLDFSGVFQRLREQFPEILIVWRILKS